MGKQKIEQDYRKKDKYSFEIREMFQDYLDGKISFGIVLNRLVSRKIIYIKEGQKVIAKPSQ